ncbi:MAG: complex I subunit 5 family protein [Vicinamibacterales bacterium]
MNAPDMLITVLALPIVASPFIYMAGRLGFLSSRRSAGLARWLSLVALAAAAFVLYRVAGDVVSYGSVAANVGAIRLQMDGLALLLAATAIGLTLVVTVFSGTYMARESGEEKFYALLTAMAGTIAGLGCAADLFNLWVWFEAMAITSYMLVAFYREQKGSLEAGVKYLVQSAVGSTLVLLAIAIAFGQTGSLSFDGIRAASGESRNLLLLAGALFVVGFGVKTALVPLHTWLPDAHSQAPSGISAMLSGIVIEAGLVALLRSLGGLAPASPTWGTLLLAFGALNMVVGNLMALRQDQVKRLLAYSSVAHMGYMLIGFGVAVGFAVPNGAAGGFFHLINHAAMKGLAFLGAGSLLYALHIARGSHVPLVRDDLNGAARRYPLTAFALSVALLALGGLPPLAGFMSKWQIFVAGFETRSLAVELLVIFAALNSVLSLAYYAPLVNRLYRCEPSPAVMAGRPVSATMNVALVLLVAVAVVPGFWPSIFSWLTEPAASSFVAVFEAVSSTLTVLP